ncbi:MAG: NAD(P)H-dependent oxidoreductase [Roseiarcus sp.]
MTRLLHVAVSPRGAASFSRRVGEALIAALRRIDPQMSIVERDLAAAPVPHPDRDFVIASLMPAAERGEGERAALALSEILIGELEACDLVVLSTPMHNFAAPSALKAWLDHVVRPGRTFRNSPAGKIGLLSDRPVLAAIACGGRFGEGAGAQADFLEPYLRYVFAVVGLSSFEALRLEELERGEGKIERSLAAARRWIDATSARFAARRRG